jgi:type I restriction enzyme S subunit
MTRWPMKPLAEFIEERTDRLGQDSTTIYSVTNESGFVRSLDLFDKRVFSADTGNYKRVGFCDLAYNPSRINVGSVAICEDKNGGAVSPMYVIVRCKPGLLPRYLLHFLKSDSGLQEIRHRCEGAVRFQLKFRDLCAIPLLAVPLTEQERIVKLLDELDKLRKLRARADRRTADLTLALFHEMFGEKMKSNQLRLEQIAEVVSGVAKGRNFNGRQPVEVPYLRVANVQAGHLDLSKITTIRALPEEVKELSLRKGDVLLTEGGDFDKLGRGAMLEQDLPNCIHQNHIFRVRAERSKLEPIYFAIFLMTTEAKRYFLGCAKQTTNLASINMRQLRALPVPVPPLPLQKEFARVQNEIRGLEAEQASSGRRLEDLFQSLLHRAFRGEL